MLPDVRCSRDSRAWLVFIIGVYTPEDAMVGCLESARVLCKEAWLIVRMHAETGYVELALERAACVHFGGVLAHEKMHVTYTG